jgi:hypothetical protein
VTGHPVPRGARRTRALALAAALAIATALPLRAHEIGTTRVAVTFPGDGSYRIEIVTDAASLLDKLEAASGRQRSGITEPSAIQQRLVALSGLFEQRVFPIFDGVPTHPAVRVQVEPATSVGGVPAAIILLTGVRPAGARTFSWAYGWTFASYGLRVHTGHSGEPFTQWLDGTDASTPVSLAALPQPISRPGVAARYVSLGFTHILPNGPDHVLFVLGVFLLSRKLRPILMQVSAFTIAHSITLGLSVYGLVSLSPSIVEPLIALSIAYIAVENLLLTEFRPWRVGLVFAFGLLHGLGFAGALRDLGLPRSELMTGLVGFNVGVELGQLSVIALAFVAVGYWYGDRTWYRRRVVLPASACIACFGVFWTIQRLHLA